MKDDYLSDYVDDFKIEVSEETNMIKSRLTIENITIRAILKLHSVNIEQISGLVTRLPTAVQKWCPITGLVEKAVPVDKELTLFILEKKLKSSDYKSIRRLLFFLPLPDCLGAIKPTFWPGGLVLETEVGFSEEDLCLPPP